MSEHQQAIRERPWDEVLSPLFASAVSDRHVVLDDALTTSAFEELRSDLLSSWAWHYRSQPGYALCLAPPESPVEHWDAQHQLEQLTGKATIHEF